MSTRPSSTEVGKAPLDVLAELAALQRAVLLCGAPTYLEKHPAPQFPADLACHNCLRYPYAPSLDEWQFLDADSNPVVVLL